MSAETRLFAGLLGLGVGIATLAPRWGMVARLRALRIRSRRVLIEDALKALWSAGAGSPSMPLTAVAGSLGVSMGRAAGIVAAIVRDGLARPEDGGYRLTARGYAAASHIVRAYRLWERHLADETGFAEDEWHARADRREHDLSPEQAARLAARLGYPAFDPHGDPIPQAGGAKPRITGGISLLHLRPGDRAQIVHVEDEPRVIYSQLVAVAAAPGVEIELLENRPESVVCRIGGEIHTLALVLAATVHVAPLAATRTSARNAAGSVGPREDTIPLFALDIGQAATVVSIAPVCRGVERHRLLDLGIVAGTRVQTELRSPGGDPTAYRVRGSLIALRAEQARQIRVLPVADGGRT